MRSCWQGWTTTRRSGGAVVRRFSAGWFRPISRVRRDTRLDTQYRQGFGDPLRVSEDLAGWDEEGSWPEA